MYLDEDFFSLYQVWGRLLFLRRVLDHHPVSFLAVHDGRGPPGKPVRSICLTSLCPAVLLEESIPSTWQHMCPRHLGLWFFLFLDPLLKFASSYSCYLHFVPVHDGIVFFFVKICYFWLKVFVALLILLFVWSCESSGFLLNCSLFLSLKCVSCFSQCSTRLFLFFLFFFCPLGDLRHVSEV